jgi:hypothetical protein
MRLEGFEPPTRGLEGRRSSTELQARNGSTIPTMPASEYIATAVGECFGEYESEDAPERQRPADKRAASRAWIPKVRTAPSPIAARRASSLRCRSNTCE